MQNLLSVLMIHLSAGHIRSKAACNQAHDFVVVNLLPVMSTACLFIFVATKDVKEEIVILISSAALRAVATSY